MEISEERKRSVSSALGNDSAFFLRFPAYCAIAYRNSMARSFIGPITIELFRTADTCFARAADVKSHTTFLECTRRYLMFF